MPILVAVFEFILFQFAVATVKDLQTVIICRFIGGSFGTYPLAVVAAVFSDIYDNRNRALAIMFFTMMVFTGPMFAPFIGDLIVENYLGWRWMGYLAGIMGASSPSSEHILLWRPNLQLSRREGRRPAAKDEKPGHSCQTGRDRV